MENSKRNGTEFFDDAIEFVAISRSKNIIIMVVGDAHS